MSQLEKEREKGRQLKVSEVEVACVATERKLILLAVAIGIIGA